MLRKNFKKEKNNCADSKQELAITMERHPPMAAGKAQITT